MTLQCLKTMQERNLYLQGMLCMWSEKALCPARVELIIKMIVVLIISCRGHLYNEYFFIVGRSIEH